MDLTMSSGLAGTKPFVLLKGTSGGLAFDESDRCVGGQGGPRGRIRSQCGRAPPSVLVDRRASPSMLVVRRASLSMAVQTR